MLSAVDRVAGGCWHGLAIWKSRAREATESMVLLKRWSRWLKEPHSTQNRHTCDGRWLPPAAHPSGHHRLGNSMSYAEGSTLIFHGVLSMHLSHQRKEIFLINQAHPEIL